jgi:hypothetical protein
VKSVLTAFSFSNIILGSSTGSTSYTSPNAGLLLRRFSVADPTGKTITKVGDIWTKRYISQRTTNCSLSASDASGSGSLLIGNNSGNPKATICHLIWLTVDQPGDWSTLTGTYQIFGDAPSSKFVSSTSKASVGDMKTK